MLSWHAASELCLQPEIYVLCVYVYGIASQRVQYCKAQRGEHD